MRYVIAGKNHLRVHNTEFVYKLNQDRHLMRKCSITHVRVTTVAVGRQLVLNILMCVCVFVASTIEHKKRKCHILVCGLPASTIFFHVT